MGTIFSSSLAFAAILHCFIPLSAFSMSSKKPSTNRDPAAFVNEGSGYVVAADSIADFIRSNDELLADEDPDNNDTIQIPIEINNRVASWIRYFTIKDRDRTIRHFQRASKYKNAIEEILEKHEVPKELFYIALIESGFVQRARSKAEAVGVWQMIRGTGANYGLSINRYVDERHNWIKSTESAITYLKDLRNVFGSWYLAFAAYNAGEYQIVQSIMRGKSRDFWTLAEGKFLPEETLNYVPKFMAAMIIGREPAKYNIVFTPEEPWSEYRSAMVPSGVKLKDLARLTNVPHELIEEWNPDVLRGIVPWSRSGRFEMYFPKEVADRVVAKEEDLANSKKRDKKIKRYAEKGKSGGYAVYVVRPGDTLIGISRTLGVSIRTLRKLNRIRTNTIHVGQRLKYYINLSKMLDTKNPNERSVASAKVGESGRLAHRVQSGESIYLIAEAYGKNVDDIIRWNQLTSLDLERDQTLFLAP